MQCAALISRSMRILFKSIFILALTGVIPFFAGCNSDGGGNSSSPNKAVQPGTVAQQCGPASNDSATIKKCDVKREELRKVSLEFLGINALQSDSDKILKEISPNNLEKIVNDAIEYSSKNTSSDTAEDDLSEISDMIKTATVNAGLDPNSADVIPGSNPARILHIGSPDYLDGRGNFAVGSAHLQNISGTNIGDIYSVVLGVGKNPDVSKSFQSYSIGLEKITSNSGGQTTIEPLSDYVESQLPCFCQGTQSQLDPETFNTLEVGASVQPENH
jgi:hypothetical protein